MRVIAGQAKGRPLKAVPGQTTRPTTDKVKEAMFSIIGPYFEGDKVLDWFAGTGGLGIEALSRGAGDAVFIDINAKSVETIRRNLEAAGFGDRAEVYKLDARKAFSVLARKGAAFDLVFLDPPYRMNDCDELLLGLSARGLVADGALAVVEHGADVAYAEMFGGFRLRRHARYGETALSVYRYDASEEQDAARIDNSVPTQSGERGDS